MQYNRSLLYTLIFAFTLCTTAPTKAEGSNYVKWIMAGIGCIAAAVYAYPWFTAGYWAHEVQKQLPKGADSISLPLADKIAYIKIIKAMPELHNADGVKTFVWGYRLKKKLHKLNLNNLSGDGQIGYLKLLHKLYTKNAKLRQNDTSIPDLRDESQDEFLIWIYKLQRAMSGNGQTSPKSSAMKIADQIEAVMLLHKVPGLHTDTGIQTIVFTLRLQQALQEDTAQDTIQSEPMPDDHKIYYLRFLHALLDAVPELRDNTEEQEKWIKTLVWAKKLQKRINEYQETLPEADKKRSSVTEKQKIEFLIFLHKHRLEHELKGEFHEEDAIEIILGLYELKQYATKLQSKFSGFADILKGNFE